MPRNRRSRAPKRLPQPPPRPGDAGRSRAAHGRPRLRQRFPWFTAVRAPTALSAALALATLAAWVAPAAAHANTGADLYHQHCAVCHQAAGTGVPNVFPPLAGNPALKDPAHVRAIIEKGLTGRLQVGGKSFDGTMPPFGGQLAGPDLQALIEYVRTAWGNDFGEPGPTGAHAAAPAGGPRATQRGSSTPAPTTAHPASAGEAAAGKALFSGRRRFRNGAPPCAACHTVQGESPLGGGTMGRDLTTAYDRLGQGTGLQTVLTTISFPVMRQAFVNRALTQSEITDLVAYLRQTAATAHEQGTADRNPNPFGFNWVWFFGIAGAALLFALLLVGWPRQRESVSERLRRTARLGRHRR